MNFRNPQRILMILSLIALTSFCGKDIQPEQYSEEELESIPMPFLWHYHSQSET
jgi:hypothetical protein